MLSTSLSLNALPSQAFLLTFLPNPHFFTEQEMQLLEKQPFYPQVLHSSHVMLLRNAFLPIKTTALAQGVCM